MCYQLASMLFLAGYILIVNIQLLFKVCWTFFHWLTMHWSWVLFGFHFLSFHCLSPFYCPWPFIVHNLSFFITFHCLIPFIVHNLSLSVTFKYPLPFIVCYSHTEQMVSFVARNLFTCIRYSRQHNTRMIHMLSWLEYLIHVPRNNST